MPGTTPRGLPYPLPTEPVAEGAAAIRALAEALDAAPRLLAEVVLSANAAEINFSAIPQTFAHLQLVMTIRSTQAAFWSDLLFRLNGDAAANYHYLRHYGSGPASGAGSSLADALNATQNGNIGQAVAANAYANTWTSAELMIPDYRSTTHYKTALGRSAARGTDVGAQIHFSTESHWTIEPRVAINRVQILLGGGGQIVAGSRASLYGLP